jgi:fumarate hydratase, class II
MNTFNQYHIERDPIGEIKVPIDAYYGAQTQRAVGNFQISGLRFPRCMIKAQGIVKAAAATVNMQLGKLPTDIGAAIVTAADEVTEGKWDYQFVADVYQAGAGTVQNMNANEVIANRASEILTGDKRSHKVHPNDHVNMSQSTNDTFPSALHIAASELMVNQLLPAIQLLHQELMKKAAEFMPVVKSGRTHLHDAVPIRLGQEFSGYAHTIASVNRQLETCLDSLYEIGLGGNAIGTLVNTDPSYPGKVIAEVCKRTSRPFRAPEDLFSFMQNRNAAMQTMLVLKELAVHLIKMTSDLRLLSSGPRTGLAEINLPAVQAGSSIMPGKVNPAILEMMHMVCCQIIGYETTISTAAQASQLEINVMMPVIAHTLLNSLVILSNAIKTMVLKCISGITANEENCQNWLNASLSLITFTSPIIGYDLASEVGKLADEQNKSLKQVLQEKNLLTPEMEKAIHPEGKV